MRSILDGHIVLSRKVAAANRYPAIDVLASISRVMPLVTSREHRAAAAHFRGLLAKYQEMELLVQIGEYKAGADALADEAIGARPATLEFLSQPPDASLPYAQSVEVLRQFGWTGERAR